MKMKLRQGVWDENGKLLRFKSVVIVHFKKNKDEIIAHIYKIEGVINKIMTNSTWHAAYFSKEGHGECEWDWITRLPSASDEESAQLINLMKACGYYPQTKGENK